MNEKPRHRSGYTSEETELVRSACLTVAVTLGAYLGDVVIVGGLVPSLFGGSRLRWSHLDGVAKGIQVADEVHEVPPHEARQVGRPVEQDGEIEVAALPMRRRPRPSALDGTEGRADRQAVMALGGERSRMRSSASNASASSTISRRSPSGLGRSPG